MRMCSQYRMGRAQRNPSTSGKVMGFGYRLYLSYNDHDVEVGKLKRTYGLRVDRDRKI